MISHEKLKSPLGNNKRSEFGLRTGTKDFRASFYKGRIVLRPVQWCKTDRPDLLLIPYR